MNELDIRKSGFDRFADVVLDKRFIQGYATAIVFTVIGLLVGIAL